eukprot:scaffold3290_cov165-Ochromonas_danica.AAC.63
MLKRKSVVEDDLPRLEDQVKRCRISQTPGELRFIVEVSKFYPHDRPSVRCLEDSIQSPHVQPGGLVTHVELMGNWRATNSLRTVIYALREVVHSNGSLIGKDNTMNVD